MLPKKLPFATNACRKKIGKGEEKMFSCAIDTVSCVVEAILVNTCGPSFSQTASGKTKLIVQAVQEPLSWRLRNGFKWNENLRNGLWDSLLTNFSDSFSPKGRGTASIDKVINEFASCQPVQVVFTAICTDGNGNCKTRNMGDYRLILIYLTTKLASNHFRYTFDVALFSHQLKLSIRGPMPTLAEKLPEIISRQLKEYLRPEARRIQCLHCKSFGANFLKLDASNLKVPNIFFVHFENDRGPDQNQSKLPLKLTEEIHLQDEDQVKVKNNYIRSLLFRVFFQSYSLISAIMHKPGHFFTISKIGKELYSYISDCPNLK